MESNDRCAQIVDPLPGAGGARAHRPAHGGARAPVARGLRELLNDATTSAAVVVVPATTATSPSPPAKTTAAASQGARAPAAPPKRKPARHATSSAQKTTSTRTVAAVTTKPARPPASRSKAHPRAPTRTGSARSLAPAPHPSTTTPPPVAPAAAAPTGALSLAANREGQLKYDKTSLEASAGAVSIDFTNMAPLAHNLTIASASGALVGATPTFQGASKTLTLNLAPGTYTFYCSVPGHRMAGMEGTLTVK